MQVVELVGDRLPDLRPRVPRVCGARRRRRHTGASTVVLLELALEAGLRELIAGIVREEVAKALAKTTAPDEYLSTRGAAELAGVADGTIRRWIREGRLTGHRAGRVVRIKRADVERLLAGDRRDAREPSPEELARRQFG